LARHVFLAASLILAAAFQSILAVRSSVIAKDGVGFIRVAKEMQDDFAAVCAREDQHPGYPLLLLAATHLARAWPNDDPFDVWIVGGRLASGVCGLLAIVLLWLFARRLYDRRIADITVLLASFWPLLRQNASDILSDTPHLIFYLAAVWLVCEGAARQRARWFAAAGISSGLAFWMRPEGLLVSLAAVIALVVARRGVRASMAATAALATTTALVVAPYFVMTGKVTSKFSNKMTYFTQSTVQGPAGDANRAVPTASPAPVEPLPAWAWQLPQCGMTCEPAPGGRLSDEQSRPGSKVWVAVNGVFELGKELAQGFYYLFLIPLAVGRFAPGRHRWQFAPSTMTATVWIAHSGLLLLLYYVAGYISHRHVIPLVALLLPMTSVGLVRIGRQLAGGVSWLASLSSPPNGWLLSGQRRAAAFEGLARPRSATAFVVTAAVLGLLPKTIRPPHECYATVVSAAQWVGAHAHPGDSVLSTSAYVRFYSQLDGAVLGSEAENLTMGLAVAPTGHPWTFLVLEVDNRVLDRKRLGVLDALYEPLFDLCAHRRKTWLRVLVYRLKQNRASYERQVEWFHGQPRARFHIASVLWAAGFAVRSQGLEADEIASRPRFFSDVTPHPNAAFLRLDMAGGPAIESPPGVA
jgi:hypothetical protein